MMQRHSSSDALTALAAALCLAGAPASSSTAVKPHIILHLADDFGWANAGWHRPEGYKEVQTPNMDALVKAGVELDHAYSYMFCSPTRSSLQSGRLPVHVNVLNLQPTTWNPEDPVSGFAAIPRNSKPPRRAVVSPQPVVPGPRARTCTPRRPRF